MSIGQKIKDARIKKGLTQEDLAAKTDISIRTIQRIENDEVDPRSFTLQAIATVLEIEYEELVKLSKNNTEINENNKGNIWIPLIHLSGLCILLIPPLIIWVWKKDSLKEIREHAVDVVNFQLSMLLYLFVSSFLIILIIGLPMLVFLGLFSTVIILINTIKVLNKQTYKYPFCIKILKR